MRYSRIKKILSLACCLLLLAACGKNNVGRLKYENNTPAPQITFEVPESSIKDNVFLDGKNVGGKKASEVENMLKVQKAQRDIRCEDAVLDQTTWQVVQNEKYGKQLNVQKTMDLLLSANGGEKVKSVIDTIKPQVTVDELTENIEILGRFKTPMMDYQEGRVHNIELAVEKIDYFKLDPGQEFSFNRVVGKRTRTKGYEEAPIIIRTKDGPKKGKGVGGGICQVASTIYNAVEESGLTITERHEHSKDVPYVPEGKDATVNYGGVDFRFVNNKPYPIMIRTYLSEGELIARIVGNKN